MKTEYIQDNMQDEIDLLELFRALWRSKWFIIVMTVIAVTSGFVYTLFQKPVYEAKIALIAPVMADLTAINYGRNYNTALKPFTPVDAFNLLRGALFADSTVHDFELEENHLSSNQTKPIVKVAMESTLRFTITATAQSPQAASHAAQNFVNLAQDVALEKLNELLNKEVYVVRLRLKNDISLAREQANQERGGQLVRLREALKLAEAAGLEQPRTFNVVTQDISNPAYLRGSKALKAEIESLEKPGSKDSFIPQLSSLQREYNALSTIQLTKENVFLARFDGKMVVSSEPVILNNKHTILVFFIVGFLLSIILVVGCNVRKQVKSLNNKVC